MLDDSWLPFEAKLGQGLTLVHFSPQREHVLWDTFGTFSKRWMSRVSSQTRHKTAHRPKRLKWSQG